MVHRRPALGNASLDIRCRPGPCSGVPPPASQASQVEQGMIRFPPNSPILVILRCHFDQVSAPPSSLRAGLRCPPRSGRFEYRTWNYRSPMWGSRGGVDREMRKHTRTHTHPHCFSTCIEDQSRSQQEKGWDATSSYQPWLLSLVVATYWVSLILTQESVPRAPIDRQPEGLAHAPARARAPCACW